MPNPREATDFTVELVVGPQRAERTLVSGHGSLLLMAVEQSRAEMGKAKKEPPQNRTLLVLGAGASIGAAKYPIESSWRQAIADMPSGDNFFYDVFFHGKSDAHANRYLNVLGLTFEGVNDLIVRAWGMKNNLRHFDPDEWRQLNIEEVFTFLDIGERMYARGTQYQRAFKTCRDELQEFVTSFLAIKSDGSHCEHLMDIIDRLQPTDSIISFNWDTIADFTLQRVNGPAYAGYLDLMMAEPLRVSDFLHRGVLLKLHGSLNWRVCLNPQCRLRNKLRLGAQDGRLVRFVEMCKCPACGNDRGRPFIVPPSSQKLIRRGTILHKLWLLAREQLQYCKRIVFIGYSFPTSDFYSEWLFRQIYFTNGGLPEIIVVNPAITKPKSATARRYQSLFRGCKIHKFSTLERFRQRGLRLLKDNQGDVK